MSVLVVEDDAIGRDAIAGILRQEGYETKTAADGREALGILADGDCRLVITDWMMPGITGIQLCRAARGHLRRLDLCDRGHVAERSARPAAGAFVRRQRFHPQTMESPAIVGSAESRRTIAGRAL